MKDENKTKNQLIGEMGFLRRQVADLEELKIRQTEEIRMLNERMGYYFPRLEQLNDALFVIFDRKFEFVNPAFEEIFGYEAGEIIGTDFETMKLIDPDWRQFVQNKFREGLRGNFSVHQFEFIGLKKDGRKVGCEASVIFIPYKWGMAIHGVLHDVTMRKRVNDELQRNIDKLQSALDAIPTSVFYMDPQNRFIKVNQALAKLFKLPASSIVGRTLPEIFPNLPQDQLSHFIQDNMEVMHSGSPKRGQIEAFPTSKGRRWVQTDRMPFRDDKGKISGMVCLAIDITNIRETEEKLWYLSFHDVLTGLYNKAYFEEELLKLDGSRQLPISIVMVKVNNYETVNRTRGHEVAHELLKRAANILKVFRTEDVVARVADDKFAGLLPQAPAEIAEVVVQRIKKALEQNNKQHEIPLEMKFDVLTKEKGSSIAGILKDAETLF